MRVSLKACTATRLRHEDDGDHEVWTLTAVDFEFEQPYERATRDDNESPCAINKTVAF